MSNDSSEPPDRRSVRREVRNRQRAVAEREAVRLARPDRPIVSTTLKHVPKEKSAVSSTPAGYGIDALLSKGHSMDTYHQSSAWCGPFAVARQMIAERDEARKKRELERAQNHPEDGTGTRHPLDEVMEQVEFERKQEEHPSLKWRGSINDNAYILNSKSNLYTDRKRRFLIQKRGLSNKKSTQQGVTSLYDLCLQFIVDNFDYVETLGLQVNSSIRTAICQSLVATGKMNGAAFDTLAEEGIETLEVIDCVQVSQDQLAEALTRLIPKGLRALVLNNCGRCFGTRAVDSIVQASKETKDLQLFAMSIGGAYLLTDKDSAMLIAAICRTISSLEFRACSLLGPEFCSAIATHFTSTSHKTNNLIELSLDSLSLNKTSLMTLAQGTDALRNVKSLSLSRMEHVDDEVLESLLQATGGNLENLNLKDIIQLSDESLNSIRRSNTNANLKSLQVSGSKGLTSAGLEAFFTAGIGNLCEPPMLQRLDISNCGNDVVNDDIVHLAATMASCKNRNDSSASMGFVHLDLSGSSVTDRSMETLTETCSLSLRVLQVNFCPNITNQGLGYLVSKLGEQLSKLEIWGCAQITDEFLDRHDRQGVGGLEISGAWMKQSGKRSSR